MRDECEESNLVLLVELEKEGEGDSVKVENTIFRAALALSFMIREFEFVKHTVLLIP